jgi:hypothetical protein
MTHHHLTSPCLPLSIPRDIYRTHLLPLLTLYRTQRTSLGSGTKRGTTIWTATMTVMKPLLPTRICTKITNNNNSNNIVNNNNYRSNKNNNRSISNRSNNDYTIFISNRSNTYPVI